MTPPPGATDIVAKLRAGSDGWRGLQAALAARPLTHPLLTDELDALVGTMIGDAVIELERVALGEVNDVYAATTASGGQLIVRVASRPHFHNERWALDAARRAGAPAPRGFAVREHDTAAATVEISVQERLPGQPLDQVFFGDEKLTDARVEGLLAAAGEVIARVHQVAVDGWGSVDRDGRGSQPDWASFVTWFSRYRERVVSASEQHDLPAGLLGRAIELLDTHGGDYMGPPRLVHGDFHGKHLLVNDGDALTGIVDFEACRGGDLVYDPAARGRGVPAERPG